MASTNKKAVNQLRTHAGGQAVQMKPIDALRRSVMCNMLWEDGFYEDGEAVGERIFRLIGECDTHDVITLIYDAKERMHLRHLPLKMAVDMTYYPQHKRRVAEVLSRVIQRADEMAEVLSIYWKNGKRPVAAQIKKGLARACAKFNEYSLAKYQGKKKTIKLRDVLCIAHPNPGTEERSDLYKRTLERKLTPPDTWEVSLSAKDGKAPKEKWERLLKEGRLGALAFLRNLRNMAEAGVDQSLVRQSMGVIDWSKALPFRFIAAARAVPYMECELELAFQQLLTNHKALSGATLVFVDVSGSMFTSLSAKSDMQRIDVACGVAMIARELSKDGMVATFSRNAVLVPGRRGFALRDAIVGSQHHGGTYLAHALTELMSTPPVCDTKFDRIIIITDEQSHDGIIEKPSNIPNGYIINVACEKNSVGYKPWVHISGWSEAVIDFIQQYEATK